MAVIFASGFDHFDTSELEDEWDYIHTHFFGAVTVQEGLGRFDTNCLGFSDTWCMISKFIEDTGPIYVGMAIDPRAGLEQEFVMFRFQCEDVTLVKIVLDTNYRVKIWAGGASALEEVGESSIPLRGGCFTYVEAKITFHDTNGAVELHVQEATVANLTSLDTGGGWDGASYEACDRFDIGGISWQRNDYIEDVLVDDVYIVDEDGSVNTDFLGDVTMEEDLPIADGYYNQFTPSPSNNHFENVDDEWNNVDENTWVAERNNGTKDTYNFPALSATQGNVYAVVMSYYVTKTSSGVRGLTALARLDEGNNNYVDGNVANEINVPVNYAFHQSIMEQDPNNNNWTVATVNNSEFGQEITS